MPLDSLFTTAQLHSYLSGDPDLFVQIASGLVRSECHWHIFPSITENRVYDGSGGRWQNLQSLKVTDVSNLVVDGDEWEPGDYRVSENGWLEAQGRFNDFAHYNRQRFPHKTKAVELTLTHGYQECPPVVLSVALGCAARAQEMPASWIRSIRAGLYQYDFGGRMSANEIGGFQLTDEEKGQLDPYRLQVVN